MESTLEGWGVHWRGGEYTGGVESIASLGFSQNSLSNRFGEESAPIVKH